MNAEAANLEAICKAMDQHDRNCGEPLLAVLMNPYEVERLDWNAIRGVPIKADAGVPTGRFRLVCSGIHGRDQGTAEEAQQAEQIEPEVVEEREPLYV